MNFSRTPQDSTAYLRVMKDFEGFLNSGGKPSFSQLSGNLPIAFSDDSVCSANTDLSSHGPDNNLHTPSSCKIKRSIGKSTKVITFEAYYS